MGDLTLSATALVVLVILMLLRVPIGVALGGVSFVGIWIILGLKPALGILTSIPYDFVAHWSLSSIPMFLLMGYICFHARLTDGLFRLARLWLSALPGGLGIATIFAAAGFSAVTGSSVACAAAMGRIAVPEMLNSGYEKGLAAGTVAAAGTIGSMIPPSILLLLYGIFAELPISHLFIAGLLPGILTAVMYSAVLIGRAVANPEDAPRIRMDAPWRERFTAIKDTWPILGLIFGVFGGLFGGVFTATEAGAVGALLAVIIGLAYRTLDWQKLRAAVMETMESTAAIFIIAIGANLLTRFLGLAGFTDFISSVVLGGEVSHLGFIIGLSLVLLFLGMFLDPIGIMLLTLPIFLPVAENIRMDLIWFGVFMAKWLEIGLITPPVGLNVFVIKGVVGDLIRTEVIFKGVLWFLAADIVTVGLMIAFPSIVTYLPTLIGG